MPLQLGQVVEWVGAAQFAGVNQAHEQVADAGPILGLVEQRVLAMQNRFLQCSFANVMPTAGLCRAGRFPNASRTRSPRWSQRVPAPLKRPSRPKPYPGSQIHSKSTYGLFKVYFERRKSMSSPTP